MLNNQTQSTIGAESLKKNLIGWISNLQGTGDPHLNDIVNELNGLRYRFGEKQPNTSEINTSVSRLHRKVKNVMATNSANQHNCLREIDQHLKDIQLQ